MKITSRVQRLIRYAERTLPTAGRNVITPIDLFMGGLYERSGVLGEFFLRGRFDIDKLEEQRSKRGLYGDATSIAPFSVPVSQKVVSILERADEMRQLYGQVFMTEGNIYSALLELSEIVSLLRYSTTGMTKSDILEIVCSPRDMAVHLRGFTDKDSNIGGVEVRRAKHTESDALIEFVKEEFGERWVQHLLTGFKRNVIPIFVAVDSEVRGFACYNVARMKEGTFGPMGTSPECRQTGIGRALLRRSLAEMERLGYDYAVINNAGPIEFYETTCGAVVIPRPHIRKL